MIHCDEVFDILTRGPFPTGAVSDGVVESHLSRCGECRRLAEALRPAIELFQEAVTPEERNALPSYLGHWHAVSDPWSNGEFDKPPEPLSLPRRRAARRQTRLPARSFAQAVPWAAAVLVGIALTSWLPRAGTTPEAGLGGVTKAERLTKTECLATAQSLTKAEWRLEQTPGQWLFEHKVREACYDPSQPLHAIVAKVNGGEASDPSASIRVACCKGCHADSGQGGKGSVPANELLATCVACHQF